MGVGVGGVREVVVIMGQECGSCGGVGWGGGVGWSWM